MKNCEVVIESVRCVQKCKEKILTILRFSMHNSGVQLNLSQNPHKVEGGGTVKSAPYTLNIQLSVVG